MKKIPIEREKSDVRISSSEREEARPKVKILFLHGFFASGQCQPALALREAFEGRAEVISPDLPTHPKEALALIRDVIDSERPDVLVGNSCGSFYAQMVAPVVGIPALLGNPHFRMTDFLSARIGRHEYKSKRLDGRQEFVIDESLIAEFAEMEAHQFNCYNPYYKDKVWGIFGEQDTLARFEPLFLEHYNHSFHFPGAHTPTAEEVKTWYVPLVEKLMMEYPVTKFTGKGHKNHICKKCAKLSKEDREKMMNSDFDEDFDLFEDIELPFDENDATCYDGYLGFVDIDRLPPSMYETKRYNKLKDTERSCLRGIVLNLIIEFWEDNRLIPDGGEVNQIMNTAIRHFEEELSFSVKNDKDMRRIVQSMVVPTINKQLRREKKKKEEG